MRNLQGKKLKKRRFRSHRASQGWQLHSEFLIWHSFPRGTFSCAKVWPSASLVRMKN
jgi:hypothetical protein